jgi:hypothetical protein
MSKQEKQRIVDAWNKHIENERRAMKYQTFSSNASEDYRSVFETGLRQHAELTDKEKHEILVLMNAKVLVR